jgi:protein-tyrosine phosphatase
VDVLVVCTANVARSPLFAALLSLEAERRVGHGAAVIASAGTHATIGESAATSTQVVSARLGFSLADHHAVPITYYDLASLPMILTMEIAHSRELISRAPSIADRTFTVREFSDIVAYRLAPSAISPLTMGRPDDMQERLREVAAVAHARRSRRLTRRSGDVPDPIGRPQADYERLAAEFETLAASVAPVLFGPEQSKRQRNALTDPSAELDRRDNVR